eukprot:5631885-Ditylum_brightwellii.AAC.1
MYYKIMQWCNMPTSSALRIANNKIGEIWNAQNAHLHMEMKDTHSTFLNKQVRNAFALQHSMFETDQLLFSMPLQDQLDGSQDAKRMWSELVKIAMHDFTTIHKSTPSQRTISSYFTSTTESIVTSPHDNNSQVTNEPGDANYMPTLI